LADAEDAYAAMLADREQAFVAGDDEFGAWTKTGSGSLNPFQ